MGRILRKEADDMMNKWDQLNTDSDDWQRRLELALDQLMELEKAEDLLDGKLSRAEMVKDAWEPVEDLVIDLLPDHIDRVKVRISDPHFRYSILFHTHRQCKTLIKQANSFLKRDNGKRCN